MGTNLECSRLLFGRVVAESYLPKGFPVAYKLYSYGKTTKYSRQDIPSLETLAYFGYEQTEPSPGQTSGKIP